MLPAVPERALLELGRTEGGPETLRFLVRDQYTRRLLLLRAVLDAAEAADAEVCSPGARGRLREDWALLEEAEGRSYGGAGPSTAFNGTSIGSQAGSQAGPQVGQSGPHTRSQPRPPVRSAAPEEPPEPALSPFRARLLHPFLGPWARHCLRGLGPVAGRRTERDARELSRDLGYFGALAAVSAARAGVSFTVRLTSRDGVLTLPSLGALRTNAPGDAPVEVVHRNHRLTFRQGGEADVVVQLQSGIGAWSGAAAWAPAYALPSLLPDTAPIPLDDLDPYRTVRDGPRHHALSGPVTLDDAERKRWLHTWSGTASALALGGEYRLEEAVALLRCLVPLSAPPGSEPGGRPGGSCSGTRREAFGAVLSTTPPTATTFAATLVHELAHAKLSALCDMLTLHRAGPQTRYFAPWRADPRPYDGLLQGAYSHLALADFFQRRALAIAHPAHRDAAWAQHARYQEQVGAVLPTLVGSDDLTAQGRQFVDQMVAVYERLAEHPAPRGQAARAEAYVKAARALWTQRHAPAE
ncbi:HEXXH motif-containing putative peptide modification protein [Streptomyces sp. NPDC060223]|uniref:aKG-HExxH-type peptide beta-hydroxylase n=1 Tax=unclassified Streptomyces TaxID=2593676 RepID=UPI003636CBDE